MIPLPGMFATIRNRLRIVGADSPYDAREGGRSQLLYHLLAAPTIDFILTTQQTLFAKSEHDNNPI